MSKKILIIEDDEDVCDFLEATLTGKGYDVEVSRNGQTGIKKIKGYNPDLVILDLMMPAIDGFGVLEHLGTLENSKFPKIIVLSAIDKISDVGKVWRMGVEAYLLKPVEVPHLLQKVKDVIGDP